MFTLLFGEGVLSVASDHMRLLGFSDTNMTLESVDIGDLGLENACKSQIPIRNKMPKPDLSAWPRPPREFDSSGGSSHRHWPCPQWLENSVFHRRA